MKNERKTMIKNESGKNEERARRRLGRPELPFPILLRLTKWDIFEVLSSKILNLQIFEILYAKSLNLQTLLIGLFWGVIQKA